MDLSNHSALPFGKEFVGFWPKANCDHFEYIKSSEKIMQEVFDQGQLSRLKLEGYKSIKSCDLKLGALNVLIGANGAGKSNFISFFRLVSEILAGRLQVTVARQGGPDALLRHGRKITDAIKAELYFGNKGYQFELEPSHDNRLFFAREDFWWNVTGVRNIDSGHFESKAEEGTGTGIDKYTLPYMKKWRVYHFHDTSDSAKIKQVHPIDDNEYLRQDGCNLAAFLLRIQKNHKAHYKKIVRIIQLVAPFFGDFHLRPTSGNGEKIDREWTEKGRDVPMKAQALSDATLRFIGLTTVLNQPKELMPSLFLIDEPELGLHPYAITILASQLKAASTMGEDFSANQIIISTQSVELVNEFETDDLIVVGRDKGETTFERPDEEKLKAWLEDYSLGEIWKKNLIGGRP